MTDGGHLGDFAGPQNMAQPAYAGCTQIEVADDDSHLVVTTPPRFPTPRAWLERLSPTTQLALETAALSNAQVALWLRKATGASDGIDVTLQETKDGVAAMQAAGLISAEEAAVLLAP